MEQRLASDGGPADRRLFPAVGVAVGSVVIAGLAVLAARADSHGSGASGSLTGLDVTVGVVFVVVAAGAAGGRLERGWVAAVGALWLVGSIAPDARLLHQSMLIIVFVGFPGGRVRGFARWLLVAAAVPVGMGVVPQPGVAVVFAAVAVVVLLSRELEVSAAWYPVAASSVLSVVLVASWRASRVVSSFDPSVVVVAYEFVLIGVAIAFPIAAAAFVARGARLADRVLGDQRLVGLGGLEVVLSEALRDPQLRVYRWQESERHYVDDRGVRAGMSDGSRGSLHVDDGSDRIGAVEHRVGALDDPPTAAAVAAAVRLAVMHLRLQQQLQAQLVELEAARVRIMAAGDRQRLAVTARLRGDVVRPLEQAIEKGRAVAATLRPDEAAEALSVVLQQLTIAADEIIGLVAGVPPADLGAGRLSDGLISLAERSPVPVTVAASPDAAGDAETEATLFYVCSEALTNAVRHAAASRIEIVLSGNDQEVALIVADDGVGGADRFGSGLQGLADRVAAHGGRLRVESPPGAGTSVTATLSRTSGSSATA
jgi:signal transduction histidine kinase